MPKSTLLIDLASAPGGVDIVAAKKHGLAVTHALSLPSKTAPASAGEIIAESILNIIEEELGL
jgi:dipicolinate synthase subunit A